MAEKYKSRTITARMVAAAQAGTAWTEARERREKAKQAVLESQLALYRAEDEEAKALKIFSGFFPIKVQYQDPDVGVFVHETPEEIRKGEPFVTLETNVCPRCWGDEYNMTENGPVVCVCDSRQEQLRGLLGWKLWLDDVRPAPVGFVWAKSTIEAQDLVRKRGLPKSMSLDHDLGDEDRVIDFLKWLSTEYYEGPVPEYTIHSANPVGALNLRSFLDSWSSTLNGETER